jgi:hypothetical protein
MNKTANAAAAAVLAVAAGVAQAQAVQEVSEPYRKDAPLPIKPYMAAPIVAVAVPVASAQPQWEVRTSDVTLAKTLQRWAEAAGYRLKWDAERNFLISATNRFDGNFETALAAVLATPGVARSDYPLEACIYANTPPLVRITRAGEQSRECAAAQ